MKTFVQKLVLIFTIVLLLSTTVSVAAAPSNNTVKIQILNVSDYHGQLFPVTVGTTQVGGAAALSAYFKAERAQNPNTIVLTAGDAVGATPPISSFFQDIPTIEAMNLMGFDVDTFGNHNFDAGIARLQTQINAANFQYVSANLENRDVNLEGVEDFKIFEFEGVKVAVIGITNPEAPELVFPGSFGTITPTDPVKAAIQARGAAKDAGADIVVVITHMGVTGFNPDGSAYGPLIDFAREVNKENNKNPKIDIIIGDHTDFQFEGVINGALVYENRSKGITYARATLTVDANNRKLLASDVDFITPVVSAVTPDPAITALLNNYNAQLIPILSNQLGASNVAIPRSDSCGRADGRLCESLVGNVVTDAMRTRYGTDFAITNSGGLRAALTCPTTDLATDYCPPFTPTPYPITYGQVLTVLPFGNVAVTLTVNGAELRAMLENGISSMPGANGRFPQVSGICFTYNIAAPIGSRVTGAVRQAADGSCSGDPVDLTAASSYSIAENDFMANGGDGYLNLANRMVTREILDQVLAEHVSANSPLAPAIQGRIVCTDSNGATAPNCPVTLP